MKVEFADCELGIGVALYVSGSEFMKADKSKEEYGSLAAATDAFYSLHNVNYYITQDDYDIVKQWVKARDAVIFVIESNRSGSNLWFEIHISIDNRYMPIIYSDDGRHYQVRSCPESKKTKEKSTLSQKSK